MCQVCDLIVLNVAYRNIECNIIIFNLFSIEAFVTI